MNILNYDRSLKKTVQENTYKVHGLLFLYNRRVGRLLNVLLRRRFISVFYGSYMKSKRSVKLIPSFIHHYNINVEEIEHPLNSFKSFNDFFIRTLKPNSRPVDPEPTHLISPADSKLFVFPIGQTTEFPVKGYWYNLNQLLKDAELAKKYEGGWCFIYRLAPNDYHRYTYIDNGTQEKVIKVNGLLHSVNPIALKVTKNLMTKNYREITILKTENFGEVAHIEVGALFVGKIVQLQNGKHSFKRGEEKGWFEFGGSTVIQLFEKGTIIPDADLVAQSAIGIESLVKVSEKVGVKVS